MPHEGRDLLVIVEIFHAPGKSFDGLLGSPHYFARVITLPVRACPDEPAFPGVAIAEVSPMVADEFSCIVRVRQELVRVNGLSSLMAILAHLRIAGSGRTW